MASSSPIDWPAVMAQLLRRMTYRQLHRCTGMSLGKLHRLTNDPRIEPGHAAGERLLELRRTISQCPEQTTSDVHNMNN